jgi:membrane fusion protein (multidrug efflux system)
VPPVDGLAQGAYVEVEIDVAGSSSDIAIPSAALVPDIEGEIVYVYSNGKALQKRVVSGLRNETNVQILSGLSPEDTLIVSGIIQLKHGSSVNLLGIE